MNTQEFEKWLCVRRGLQPITLQGYSGAIKRLVKVLRTEVPSHEQIENFVNILYNSGYSYSHKTNTVLAIEQYMAFIGNPIKLGRQKKPRTIVKNTLNESEITRLLFNCANVREKAILTLLSYSGLRNKELCNLKVNDIDFGNNTIRVLQGKGIKDAITYVSGACIRLVLDYLSRFPRQETDYLFTTLRHNHKFKGQDLRKVVKKVAKKAQIPKRVYPHLLRHSLATNMINRGASILTVKNQLRHAWIDSTMIYVNSIAYGVKTDYERHAPSYL
jgi:integrase/recombinase XerD